MADKSRPTEIRGLAGGAERIPVETFGMTADQSATLESWLLHLPGQAIWHHYTLSMIHLRNIEGVKPAVRQHDEAEYELMLVALDPDKGPTATDRESLHPLRPINFVRQFHFARGSDDDRARRLCATFVVYLVHGDLPAELQGIRGAEELWSRTVDAAVRVVSAVPLVGDPDEAGDD